jgi:four helix bundle protein
MHPARGLKAWDAADRLADEVRAAIDKVRRGRQRYKLIDQLCRAADAISLHISEGSGRKTVADQVHFYVWAGRPLRRF